MLDLLRSFRRPARSSRRHRAAMAFGEALESRTLLAGNVVATLANGSLSLRGDSAANSVEVTVVGSDLVVRGLDGTTINNSTDAFVIEAGATTFAGDVDVNLGRGADTFLLTGPLTIGGSVRSHDFSGTGEFAITDATVEGDVHVHASSSADTVSFVNAAIDGELWADLGNGRNFVSLLDSTVLGEMRVRTGNRNDVLLLDNTMVGGLHADTGGWIDDIILRNSTINGDLHALTGSERDFVLIENSTVTGDTQLWLGWDSDLVVTQGTVDFAGDFFAAGILGRRDTIELSGGTTIGGESRIIAFEHESLASLTGTNARIGRRLAEALTFQALLNGVDIGPLTLTVDTSSNTSAVQSNNTLITKADTFTITGTTLPFATVSVTADINGGVIDLGNVPVAADGTYSIVITLLDGPTVITVTATDILNRTLMETFNLHVAVGTVVRYVSSQGTFDVELFDADAPLTVANFLNYSSRYADSIVHRKAVQSVAGVDVIQGGGFTLDASDNVQQIVTDPPVASEFNAARSNVRKTIAVATAGNPNSGTSQWFINVVDNTSLDAQQFTVFGEVIGDGMTVVDAIFALPRIDINDVVPLSTTALGEVPLDGYTLQPVQLTGTVSVAANSIQVDGTGTLFTTELAVNDVITIEGQSFRVIQINNNTSLLVDSSQSTPVTNAIYFTEPIATTVPTRNQYVVFSSIGVLL